MSLSKLSYRVSRALIAGLVMLLSVSTLSAQTFYGSIIGAITDGSGATIPDAQVILINTAKNERTQATSDSSGTYRFLNLVPGQYQLEFTKNGFEKVLRSNVTVQVQISVRIDAQLKVGEITFVVEVSGQTPLVQTENASLGQIVSSKTVAEMPLNGRNVMNLITLSPGVVQQPGAAGSTTGNGGNGSVTQVGFWGNYQISGAMSNESATFLDGTPLNGLNGNAVLLVPTQDAIQEFRVESSNVAPESGRFGGGVVNFTSKSGGDSFHGAAYEYLRNRVFNANAYFNNNAGLSRPQFNRSQYGANLGGPIRRGKSFFFVGWENLADKFEVPTLATIPSAAMLAGDFSAAGIPKIYDPLTVCGKYGNPACANDANGNPIYVRQQFLGNKIPASRIDIAANVMKNFWAPRNTPTSALVNNYTVNQYLRTQQQQYNARFDEAISSKQNAFARYTFWRGSEAAGLPFNAPTTGGPITYHAVSGTVGDTYVVSPTLIVDARASIVRFQAVKLSSSFGQQLSQFGPGWASLQNQVSFPVYPGPVVQGMFSFANIALTNYETDNIFVISGNVTKILGRHSLKIGAEGRRMEWYFNNSSAAAGIYNFDNGFTSQNPQSPSGSGFGMASFLLGYPATGSATEVRPTSQYNAYGGIYLQDTFHLNSRLVVTGGMRWDVAPGFLKEKHGNSAVFLPDVKDPLTASTGLALQGQAALVSSNLYNESTLHPARRTLLAPRLGLNYSADGGLVLRAGYGLVYLPSSVSTTDAPWDTAANSGITNMITSNDGGITPANVLANPFPNGSIQAPGRNATALSLGTEGGSFLAPLTRIAYPYMQQWSADIQKEWLGGLLTEFAYVGANGTHLPFNGSPQLNQLSDQFLTQGASLIKQVANPLYNIVPAVVGTLGRPTVLAGQLLRPYPQFYSVTNPALYAASSTYNSLQAKAEKRFGSQGGILLGNYTWAKFLSNTDAPNGSTGLVGTVQDWNNTHLDKSLVTYDVRHRGLVSYVYELPFGHGKKYLASSKNLVQALAGGWQVAGIVTFQTGFPLVFTSSATSVSNFFGGGTPRPNVVPGCNKQISGSAVSRLNKGFNTSCFTAPSTYGFGNESRTDSSLRAQGVDNVDMSLSKATALTERVRVLFRVEAFNTFNRVQFNAPGTTFGAATFGVVSSTVASQANQPRLLQLSLRASF